ncbi:MAG TPA: hypothetical protein VMS78_10335 [Rhizomicrobium sp.]|nr:hypothetical protein [Rhizomicrobium sp.]
MTPHIERHDSLRSDISERRAKQGIALGHMRYVLHVSLLLAVIAGVFLYLAFFH